MSSRPGRAGRGLVTPGFQTPLPLLLLVLFLLPAAGCGKKGNPQPPVRQVPAPVRDLVVEQRGPRVLLGFTYPKLTPAGTALEGVTAVEVWEVARSLGSGGTPRALDQREFRAAARQRLLLPTAEVGAATSGDRVVVPLPLPEPLPATPQAYYFSVRAAGPRGDVSEHSNPVVIVPRTPPEPPRETRVTPRGDGILIEWEPSEQPPGAITPPGQPAPAAPPSPPGAPAGPGEEPAPMANGPVREPGATSTGQVEEPAAAAAGETAATAQSESSQEEPVSPATGQAEPAPAAPAAPGGIAGYNVYRRSSLERSFGAPLQTVAPEQHSFVDTTARYGESYIYAVATVVQRSPLIESAVRSEHEVRYQDRFAPPVPREPVALVEGGRVRLLWRSSDAPDLAGYLVYRSDGSGPFARLTERPQAELELSDPNVTPGTYTYRVTAVDQNGNESAPAEVTATVERSPG